MCILSGSPERVSKAQILAFHAADGRHQVTVYSNEVRLARRISTTYVPWGEPGGGGDGDGNDVAECAMVLPFPAGGACEMIDTTSSKGIFAALNDLFPGVLSYSLGSRGGFGGADGATLEVKSCGSYDYSVAPTVDDLSRLDASLRIGDVMDLLRRVYGTGFSFLVCGIRKSAQTTPSRTGTRCAPMGACSCPRSTSTGPPRTRTAPCGTTSSFRFARGTRSRSRSRRVT